MKDCEQVYRMGISANNKAIYVSRCAFCNHLTWSLPLACQKQLPESSECLQFSKVSDVSLRVDDLFAFLPNDYGKEL